MFCGVLLVTDIISGVLKGMGAPSVVSAGIQTSCENLEGTGAFCVECLMLLLPQMLRDPQDFRSVCFWWTQILPMKNTLTLGLSAKKTTNKLERPKKKQFWEFVG